MCKSSLDTGVHRNGERETLCNIVLTGAKVSSFFSKNVFIDAATRSLPAKNPRPLDLEIHD